MSREYKDNRIKLLRNEQNQGVSYSRNVGLRNATGEYIFFLDSDDYIDINLFEKVTQIDKFEEYDMVIFGKTFKTNEEYKRAILPLKEGGYEFSKLLTSDIDSFLDVSIGVWITNKLYKKEILESLEFDVNLTNGEDMKFCCEAITKSNNFYLLENYGTYYNRDNDGSLSKKGHG